ncbi:MAG: CRISPR-associated helicase Cas3' [Candidatus Electrothrix sp. MAN1_4]|nr:CRISPR-associated helicase Cas3' [Candidatus Electrothrix sp. MAN1_4]
MNQYYAHSLEDQPLDQWQTLEKHLEKTAELSRSFAEQFNAGHWGELAGRFHDLGKGSREFQAYLRRANDIEDEFAAYYEPRRKQDHATFGAKYIYKLSQHPEGKLLKLLVYCLAGHHGGLQNWSNDKKSGVRYRVEEKKLKEVLFPFNQQPNIPAIPPLQFDLTDQTLCGFQLQFFVRMLFSCLVDADRLDTERFCSPDKAEKRENTVPFDQLYSVFWKNFDTLRKTAKASKVNDIREKVLSDCLAAAKQKPGLFTLTVPTGGGKTLASLAFALEHAKLFAHEKGFRRIIYVIPFTSIIEQNAKVFREMLGDEAVLEHHSNFIPSEENWKTKLVTENWDAPVVVTTNVQFFDSFFANKTSKCRKLHNIANSIVIFDEVQAIPVEKLQPCIEVLRELTTNYGVSTVLCTATQPAIGKSTGFKSGLELEQAEIIKDVPALFHKLRRTRQTWLGPRNQEEIANRLREEEQALCIVSTRDQALELFAEIEDMEGAFHLSALMYPEHRSRVLKEIRERLHPDNPQPCRVVSTQLIEAGVDVDFPVVFRCLAGMDSIAQAAGRCNREGRQELGEVFIYEPENMPSASYFRQTADSAKRLFRPFAEKLLEPECIQAYFADYFWKNQHQMDTDDILKLCQAGVAGDFAFEDLAKFRMIENANQTVVIAIEEDIVELVRKLEYVESPKKILRILQRYSVQIYPNQFNELRDWLEEPYPGVFVLKNEELYAKETGLQCQSPEGQGFIL